MSDAPKSLDDQLQDQREQSENTIRELETQLMRAKEGYLKICGAQEYAVILKKQAEEASESVTTEVVDP